MHDAYEIARAVAENNDDRRRYCWQETELCTRGQNCCVPSYRGRPEEGLSHSLIQIATAHVFASDARHKHAFTVGQVADRWRIRTAWVDMEIVARAG